MRMVAPQMRGEHGEAAGKNKEAVMDTLTKEDFERFAIFIRENGFDATFWGKIHTYYDFEGRYYWTMGAPIEETYILNRCDASEYVVENGEMRWKKACGESKEL